MHHPAIITVLFHPDDEIGQKVADRFVTHFDKLGMRRAGVNMRLPVRLRSEALFVDGRLRPIEPEGGALQVIVVLHGPEMDDNKAPWLTVCEEARSTCAAVGLWRRLRAGRPISN